MTNHENPSPESITVDRVSVVEHLRTEAASSRRVTYPACLATRYDPTGLRRRESDVAVGRAASVTA